MDNFIEVLVPIVRNIVLALLTLFIGLMIIKSIKVKTANIIEKSKLDQSLKPFMISLVTGSLKVLLVISVIGILGVDTSSFLAVIAAAGFAVGLAFQGSLSNFAGGVLLLTMRPLRVGDFVEVNGFSGTVQGIQILYTELITPDNKVVYIPNGELSNNSIVNYSIKETRRVEFKFGVGYETDSDKVKYLLNDIVEKHAMVLGEPEPFVRMSEHGDSAVVYTVRVWVNAVDYWTVYFDIIETVKKRFDQEGISIPFPQMDVHINKNY